MCGIAGVVGEGPGGALEATVGDMLATLTHRGPDDQGVWTDPNGRAALGHRRLSIIDLIAGHQPMANEDESVWVAFNGCVYNYQDLRRELYGLGHRFRTHSDTEVILHAYEQWGLECVGRFNGMWAFAIWDGRHNRLFCSRDRLGIKPFYYAWDGRRLYLASEIKALMAAEAVPAAPCQEALRQYLTFQFCLGDRTLFEGVRKLEPGHNLTFEPGGEPTCEPYWDIRLDRMDTVHNEGYFVDQLGRLLEDAVRLRLRADVPLGAHLSGGLDSSTIVCLSRLLLGEEVPIKTFTGAFRDGQAYDETAHARLVAERAGTEYMERYLDAAAFPESMERIVHMMDEPAAGPGVYPQYWVSKLASENVKVVLGGQGGDEIFIGYARYLVAYLEECLRGAIEETADRANYVATLKTIVPSLSSLQNYVPMLQSFWREGLFEPPARRYFRLVDRFSDSQRLLHGDLRFDHESSFREFEAIFDSHGASAMINRIMNFDLKTHLQSLLHVEDRTSMAWGLESRVPLLDHRIVEFIASVPPVTKFKNGQLKWLFRQSIQNLIPEEILQRKDKMGFPVPLSHWFKTELRDYVSDVLLGERSRQRGLFDPDALEAELRSEKPFSRSTWGALNLELWHRTFIDGRG
jgi:asparagine synthase (glutamine-hydrolysing)